MAEASDETYPAGELVIEIVGKRCESVIFKGTQDLVRGRWERAKLFYTEVSEVISKGPDLPGMCIAVNPRMAKGRIFDPLSSEKNQELRMRAREWAKAELKEMFDFHPTMEHKDMTETTIKTWLWEIRQLVDSGYAEVRSGNLPTFDQIKKMPGKTRMDQMNSNANMRGRFREDVLPTPSERVA